MDSSSPFHLALSSPATHIYRCINAFLAFLISIESAEARLHHIHMYVSCLQQEVRNKKADTKEAFLQKVMINDGIKALTAIATGITKDLVSRSREFAGETGLDFSYSRISGKFEMGLCSYQQESNLNHSRQQSKMSMEYRGGNPFQHSLDSGNQTQQRGGYYPVEELRALILYSRSPQSRMQSALMQLNFMHFLEAGLIKIASALGIPLETYAQGKPLIVKINLVAPTATNINQVNYVQDATGGNYENYARAANRPRPRLNIRKPQRRIWTTDLQAKFKNAVQMLGGPKLATPAHIWKTMKDDTVTVCQVKSYLQRYRYSQKQIAETLKLGLP